MKKTLKIALSVVFVLAIVFSSLAFVSAETESAFEGRAYATVVTASDFQDYDSKAFIRFGNILGLMKEDGMVQPCSMLSAGDYSRILPDYATAGIVQLKSAMLGVYPEMDENAILCIQGNHDIKSAGFIPTGFSDMGSYCLYAINENDFPWDQYLTNGSKVKKTAADVEEKLNAMIEAEDFRPVIIITHVPLHHTRRGGGGDNQYASYLFDVINKAAEKLDIIFLFGHNHSSDYDDYIGGSVNYIAKGETIRIPYADKRSETEYKEETLNFTYTNAGYVGYSGNGTENGSTNVLTVGAIQFTKDSFHLVKYAESGVIATYDVDRINVDDSDTIGGISAAKIPVINNSFLYELAKKIINFLLSIFKTFPI